MYTLVYLNGNFNRPDTLSSFLQANVGKSPLVQIDCVTPFKGTADDLTQKICEYLNCIEPQIEVAFVDTKNASIETTKSIQLVSFMVLQIKVSCK